MSEANAIGLFTRCVTSCSPEILAMGLQSSVQRLVVYDLIRR